MAEEFLGFHEPTENWSKLPNELITQFSRIETLAELKVILYILRHTWGYGDDDPKKITMDEFQYGRKKRNGTRIDTGVGMMPQAIRDGLGRAESHGFIVVERDDTDAARKEKWYAIKMSPKPGGENHPSISGGGEDHPSGGWKSPIGGTEITHRTEKETKERDSREESASGKRPPKKDRGAKYPQKTLEAKAGEHSGEDGVTTSDGKKRPKLRSNLYVRIQKLFPGRTIPVKAEDQMDLPVSTGDSGTAPSPNEAYEASETFRAWLEDEVFPYFQGLPDDKTGGPKHLVNLIRTSYNSEHNSYFEYRKRNQVAADMERVRKVHDQEEQERTSKIVGVRSEVDIFHEKLAKGEVSVEDAFRTDDLE